MKSIDIEIIFTGSVQVEQKGVCDKALKNMIKTGIRARLASFNIEGSEILRGYVKDCSVDQIPTIFYIP